MRYNHYDRRCKDPSDLQEHPIKVRLTDAELDEFSSASVLNTDGKLAPYIKQCALLGHQLRQQQRNRALAMLAGTTGESAGADPVSKQALVIALQDLIRQGLKAQQQAARAA